ncbi:MAG: ATP-binding protein [Limisphaerales bacterium]
MKLEIAVRKRAEALLDGQKRVLEMIAADAPMAKSLAALIRLIEAHVPGMLGSILLLDKDETRLRHGAAPSLPAQYMAAIDGHSIGPNAGSCGTAAYCKKSVFVEDIATDPRWRRYRRVALPHGLRACWSTPIFDTRRRVLGTFAMYYRHSALPEREHMRLIEMATHVAAIAISRERDRKVLRESAAKLKEAQHLARIGYWERDLLADHITWSEETCRIFGLEAQDPKLNQARFQEMIHPDDRHLQIQALAELQNRGRPYDLEYRIVLPNGQLRFVHAWDAIERDDSGRPIRLFGTVQDITERKRSEALLLAQAQEIKAIVENSPDLIVRFDRKLCRIYVNPAFVKATGLPEEALLGREIASTAKDGAAPATAQEVEILERSLKRAFETRRPLDFAVTWPMQAGRKFLTVHLEPEFDAQGELASILAISRDLTELKEGEEKLRQAEAKMVRVARLTMMGELTASIAHEVNQPLVVMLTYADAASQWLAALPPNLNEARVAVHRIAREAGRASEVIRRIRALFRKGDPAKTPVNINELVAETLMLVNAELNRQEVSLQTQLAPRLPLVPADRVQVQQVLLNLLMNAIDSLSAEVQRARVLRIRTRSKRGVVQVAVQDTGSGIAPQAFKHLFKPFYTTKPDGLGMGLALSRSIVEAHGGKIWITPNDEGGAIFQFTLPIKPGDVP